MKKVVLTTVTAVAVSSCLFCSSVSVSASSIVLKKGMQGNTVTKLQTDLKKLGYFNDNATGYYGDVTAAAVKKLQKKYGYAQDGIAGNNTIGLINKLLGGSGSTSSRGNTSSTASKLLKKGMSGSEVTALQTNLKKLGYFNYNITGYYGDITVSSVKKLQSKYGQTVDGIAGGNTQSLVNKLLEGKKVTVSRSASVQTTNQTSSNYLMKWFGGAENVFKIGKVATVYDIATGLSFKAKRTYGHNHADCEPLTANDTKTMKKIFGGNWSWERRAIIVNVDGKKIAASMAGMPHAGNESMPGNTYVNSRSGGYGRGTNLDAVKGNSMSGHFDIHFYGSKTHGTNKVDSKHQSMVKKAAEWAKKNY